MTTGTELNIQYTAIYIRMYLSITINTVKLVNVKIITKTCNFNACTILTANSKGILICTYA